jgi:2'-5' RNA ligase
MVWLLQALSNSIWALAHLKSRGMDMDALHNAQIMRFMNELAAAAARALSRPHATLQPPGSAGEPRLAEAQRYLALVEREFSCQVRHSLLQALC